MNSKVSLFTLTAIAIWIAIAGFVPSMPQPIATARADLELSVRLAPPIKYILKTSYAKVESALSHANDLLEKAKALEADAKLHNAQDIMDNYEKIRLQISEKIEKLNRIKASFDSMIGEINKWPPNYVQYRDTLSTDSDTAERLDYSLQSEESLLSEPVQYPVQHSVQTPPNAQTSANVFAPNESFVSKTPATPTVSPASITINGKEFTEGQKFSVTRKDSSGKETGDEYEVDSVDSKNGTATVTGPDGSKYTISADSNGGIKFARLTEQVSGMKAVDAASGSVSTTVITVSIIGTALVYALSNSNSTGTIGTTGTAR